jgi:hypothetical protein
VRDSNTDTALRSDNQKSNFLNQNEAALINIGILELVATGVLSTRISFLLKLDKKSLSFGPRSRCAHFAFAQVWKPGTQIQN